MIKYLDIGLTMSRDSNGQKLVDDAKLRIPKWSDDSNIHTCDRLVDLPNRAVAIHTGKSNLLVLDFDDELFNNALLLNNELQEDYKCSYISKSVGKDGGHFIYEYNENLLTDFIANPNGKKSNKLDVLYGNTLVFGSNAANTTKQLLVANATLTTIPIAMQQLVIARYLKTAPAEAKSSAIEYNNNTKLGSLVTQALASESHLISLLKIITPNSYKVQMANSRKKLFEYHPDRLQSDAHMYIVALSGVFMLDDSIDTELHKKIIIYINSLFSEPLDNDRLNSILKRDINSAKYRYDANWKTKSLIITNKRSEPLEVFMFTERKAINYIVYNHVTKEINTYLAPISVIDFMSSEAKIKLDKAKLTKNAIHVKLITRPDELFGQDYEKLTFNTYSRNKEQSIFYNPLEYKQQWDTKYQDLDYNDNHPYYPKVTLKALESAVGKDTLYNLFLPFMKRKYKTHDYSPLFFVFFGVPHSFKSAIVNGVFAALSQDRYIVPKLEAVHDKYNDWLINKDLVLLEEVHHLTKFDLTKLIKLINEITGSGDISGVRRMHQSLDSNKYPQEITFILTTNEAVQLTTESRDRRMVVFSNFTTAADALGMTNTDIEKTIKAETEYFAYYLSTEVRALYGDDYIANYNWKNMSYKLFQENALTNEDRLIKAIDNNNIQQFIDLLVELGQTEDDIADSFYQLVKRPGYKLRLYNSRPDVAEVVGVFNLLNVDINVVKKKLQVISHLTYNIQEYATNTSIITGSRKIEWSIAVKDVPQFILDRNKVEKIEDESIL